VPGVLKKPVLVPVFGIDHITGIRITVFFSGIYTGSVFIPEFRSRDPGGIRYSVFFLFIAF
jgi:hypothetical protein